MVKEELCGEYRSLMSAFALSVWIESVKIVPVTTTATGLRWQLLASTKHTVLLKSTDRWFREKKSLPIRSPL